MTGTKSSVAILGLGAMGAALAKAQCAAGHVVTVWNRTPNRAMFLDALGVRRAESAADAVTSSRFVIVCLLDDASVSDVLSPLAEKLRGRIVVNLTSGTPDEARAKARWAAERGIAYVDGGIMAVPPMIGTEHAMILYSGDDAAFAEAEPVLGSLGAARFIGTEPGRAALVDISLLVAMYGLLGGFVQAAVTALDGGLAARDLAAFTVPWIHAMTSTLPAMAGHIDMRTFGDDVGSPLAMQAVGMKTLIAASRAAGADAGLLTVVDGWMRAAVAAGHGHEDFGRLVDFARLPASSDVAR